MGFFCSLHRQNQSTEMMALQWRISSIDMKLAYAGELELSLKSLPGALEVRVFMDNLVGRGLKNGLIGWRRNQKCVENCPPFLSLPLGGATGVMS